MSRDQNAIVEENMIFTDNLNKIFPEQNNPHNENETPYQNNAFNKIRLYKIWPGKNKFYCYGFLMHGPEINGFAIVFFIKIFFSAIFFGLVTPYLWNYEIYYFPIMTLILFLLTIFLMFITGCIDPGIIPRKPIIKKIDNKEKLGMFIKSEEEDKINIEHHKYKYCHTCNIYRPPLCAHCLYLCYYSVY